MKCTPKVDMFYSFLITRCLTRETNKGIFNEALHTKATTSFPNGRYKVSIPHNLHKPYSFMESNVHPVQDSAKLVSPQEFFEGWEDGEWIVLLQFQDEGLHTLQESKVLGTGEASG